MTLATRTMASPVGKLTLIASEFGLVAVLWENEAIGRVKFDEAVEIAKHGLLIEAKQQLVEYFAGQRTAFDLPLDVRGTDFQKSVWCALRDIPFGETRSYAEIAATLGRPGASRAVGAANSRNPLSIVAPCHRVIGKNGSMTGFAGGIPAKEYLLRLERDVLLR